MSNCAGYNCDSLGSHTLNDCDEATIGGIQALLVLSCDTQLTDPSDATEVNAEIAAGRATLIKDVKAGLSPASPVTIDSLKACGLQKLIRYDRELSLIDGNVNDAQVSFYNGLFSGDSHGGLVLYECAEDKVVWIDAEVMATGSKVIPDNDAEAQRYEGTFSWRASKDAVDGTRYDAPAGIFS